MTSEAHKPALERATQPAQDFAARVLTWFDLHGRHDLPWQDTRDPYRIWISEIMLQQTRVATVIPYYQRFMNRFPEVAALAQAPLDEVLALWSGLGYYARARNLHQAAQQVMRELGGRFPDDYASLSSLPGIGRSTAGAIAALAGGDRHPILDGNVKRVLSRYFALSVSPACAEGQRQLWKWAEMLTPSVRVADYTQAMMDLGATVCTRSRPACQACPLALDCQAFALGRPQDFPRSSPRRIRPARTCYMVLAQRDDGAVLLLRRPPHGIWGGLWSLPEFKERIQAEAWCEQELGYSGDYVQWPPLHHAFTHFELTIIPLSIHLHANRQSSMVAMDWVWYNSGHAKTGGIAAPVARLLMRLAQPVALQQSLDLEAR